MRRNFLIVVAIILIDYGCSSQPFIERTLQPALTGTMQADYRTALSRTAWPRTAWSYSRENSVKFKYRGGLSESCKKKTGNLMAIKFQLRLIEGKYAYHLLLNYGFNG